MTQHPVRNEWDLPTAYRPRQRNRGRSIFNEAGSTITFVGFVEAISRDEKGFLFPSENAEGDRWNRGYSTLEQPLMQPYNRFELFRRCLHALIFVSSFLSLSLSLSLRDCSLISVVFETLDTCYTIVREAKLLQEKIEQYRQMSSVEIHVNWGERTCRRTKLTNDGKQRDASWKLATSSVCEIFGCWLFVNLVSMPHFVVMSRGVRKARKLGKPSSVDAGNLYWLTQMKLLLPRYTSRYQPSKVHKEVINVSRIRKTSVISLETLSKGLREGSQRNSGKEINLGFGFCILKCWVLSFLLQYLFFFFLFFYTRLETVSANFHFWRSSLIFWHFPFPRSVDNACECTKCHFSLFSRASSGEVFKSK